MGFAITLLVQGKGACVRCQKRKLSGLDSPPSTQGFGPSSVISFQAVWDDTFQFLF